MLDPHGHVLSLYNPLSRAAGYQKVFSHMNIYEKIFRNVPRIYGVPGENQLILDSLGIHWKPSRLENGSYLLIGCRLEEEELHRFGGLPKKLEEVKVAETGIYLPGMALITPEILDDYLERVVGLHNASSLYCSKQGLPELLLVVESVNSLIALTFDPGYSDLQAILELIAAFLTALTGGRGAFAFSYKYPGRILTLWCGGGPEIMQTLAADWETIGRVEEPAKVFDSQVRDKVEKKYGTIFEGTYRRCNGGSLYLGLIGAESELFKEALTALAEKATIALEISLLSTVFQYRWGMVFNSIRQGIIVVDSRGLVIMINQAAKNFFNGYSMVVPLAGEAITGSGFDGQIERAVCIAARSNCSFMHERSTIGKGDSLLHLYWDVVPLQREDGCSAGAVLVFKDITEQVRVRQEIHDWGKLTTAGEIAAGIAHEVRNPLATAKAAIQLARIIKNPLKQQELLAKLEREMDRMNDILTNFLEISKPQQENVQEPVDLNQSLREVSYLLNSEALLSDVELEINLCTGNPPVVLGSSNNMKQVFLNLARNAIEAMGEGGKLIISTLLCNGQARVTFSDNGPGIPAENMAALTKPFFTTKREGTGLGLPISTSIVEMMGGDLKIASKPGWGTTVNLVLPIYRDEALHNRPGSKDA